MKSCSPMFKLFTVLLCTAVCLPVAFGQDFKYRGSVYGGPGYGKFYDDEGSLGTGVTYRAGAELRLKRVGFEGELLGISFRRGDYFKVHGNAQFGLANLTCYFLSRSRVQPYLKVGAGAYKTSYSYSWPSIQQPEYRNSRSGAAVSVGGGIRIFINHHWSINPDFRLTGGVGFFSLVNYTSASIAYHW